MENYIFRVGFNVFFPYGNYVDGLYIDEEWCVFVFDNAPASICSFVCKTMKSYERTVRKYIYIYTQCRVQNPLCHSMMRERTSWRRGLGGGGAAARRIMKNQHKKITRRAHISHFPTHSHISLSPFVCAFGAHPSASIIIMFALFVLVGSTLAWYIYYTHIPHRRWRSRWWCKYNPPKHTVCGCVYLHLMLSRI